MVFSSAIFLFIFLPVVFLLDRLFKSLEVKNCLLVLASLVFYAFGDLHFLPLMLGSVVINYLGGIFVVKEGKSGKTALILCVTANLLLLCSFKYLDFIISTINLIPAFNIPLAGIRLPIGISFFTFQGMSYVIDAYRDHSNSNSRFSDVLLYISLFPQLVAGPIVKYHDVAYQIHHRSIDYNLTAKGIKRFITGLSKKMLLANTIGYAADAVYTLDSNVLDARLAWLGAICYTLQIYFDFSGYSDMAIGLGKIFGFNFLENFEHPYISHSIGEFWTRWHISLSTWFKEYVYIPLGGNKKGSARTRLNRIIVFLLSGLWHGANWTFVIWGLWHGVLMLIEDASPRFRRLIDSWFGHIYTMLCVVLGFVLFRADTLTQAWIMLKAMFTGFSFGNDGTAILMNLLSPSLMVMLLLGVLLSIDLKEIYKSKYPGITSPELLGSKAQWPVSMALLLLCIISIAASDFNPFIYFQF